MRLLFVLPVKGGGGGAHSVTQEVRELINMGVDAAIAVNRSNYPIFCTTYADMPELRRNLLPFSDSKSLAGLFDRQDIVIATIFTSVSLIKEALKHTEAEPKIAYYAQDYEPLFVHPEDPLWKSAYNSYTLIDGMTVFAKTDWIRNIIKSNHQIDVQKVAPSLDHDTYKPNFFKPSDQIWISAMVRPSSPRRAPKRTMKVLKQISDLYAEKVNINIFGCSNKQIAENDLISDFTYTNHEILSRNQVSAILAKSHLFIDLSDYQAFGRTGLEAMACGAVSIMPSIGGADEYIINGINGYSVDPRAERRTLSVIEKYIEMDDFRKSEIHKQAINTSLNYSTRKAAISEYRLFQKLLKQ